MLEHLYDMSELSEVKKELLNALISCHMTVSDLDGLLNGKKPENSTEKEKTRSETK